MTIKNFIQKSLRIIRKNLYKIPDKLFHSAAKLKNSAPKILLISHELSLTGAPIVLFNIAKILKKNNFEVFVISYQNGKLIDEYKRLGIPVFITEFIQSDIRRFQKLACMFDLVIANTIGTYKAVWYIHLLVKYIWFIHEAKAFETILLPAYSIPKDHCPSVIDVLNNAHDIYTVSEYSQKVFEKYSKNIKLIYNGIEDKLSLLPKQKTENKLVFSFIALISKRKACDIFLEAIEKLPNNYKTKVIFNIIGKLPDNYALNLKKQYPNSANWIGEISDRQTLTELYAQTDLLVCVSRDDPAPLVVTEASMFGIPSVISENVGSTYLIKDEESGFIVPTGDAKALCNVFIKIIKNPEILNPMKKKVRENYLKTSTMEMFEKNFINIINSKLSENKIS